MIISFCLSLFIEGIQYVTRQGYFDVDDIWNNLWGTAIGYGLYICVREIMNGIFKGTGVMKRRIVMGYCHGFLSCSFSHAFYG